ncbi:MAG: apolipoprotein N-acyltransferase [Planctomycetota bacterium]|jgi:apolipoprotein N-acyltransferase
MGDAVEIERTDLGPGARAARIGAAWGAFLLGSPGTLEPGGHVLGALLFAALWCSTAVRPGRAAFWIEWALASIGFGVLMGWLAYISTPAVPAAGIGMGFYAAVAGVAARRASFRVPPLLAATVAWVGFETLRDLIPTPFGMGWLRLGHLAADIELLAGSARWYGVVGLSLVLTGVGAGATALLGPRPLPAVERRVARLFVTALPVLAVGLSSFGAPEVEAGPTVLLVQPNIGQARKQLGVDWGDIITSQRRLSIEGQADGPVDLVCWSETFLGVDLFSADALAAVENGIEFDPWQAAVLGPSDIRASGSVDLEQALVKERILGIGLPQGDLLPGTAFLAGAEEWRAIDGRLRRVNAAVLWSAEGASTSFSKRHMVPLGETMWGLERFDWARDWIDGYLADLVAADDPRPLVFEDREGRAWRIGTPICFDNAYLDTFRDDVDLHVVLSNEAWYRRSFELDHMVAFSRLAAIATGRSVVRCTNSGIGYACDPEGRELARLVVAGEDREVKGTLRVEVPVPVDPTFRTGFSRWGAVLRWAAAGAGILIGMLGGSRRA